LYFSHAKEIREDHDELNWQTQLLPQGDKEKGNTEKMTTARLGPMPWISGS